MLNIHKPKFDRIEKRPDFTLGVILSLAILVMICFVLSFIAYILLKEFRPTAQQDVPLIIMPTTALPTAMPVNHFLIYLPGTLSGSVPVSEPIWKVSKLSIQGYKLDGQRYDLATFKRNDGQATGKGYCINPGWDVPDLGTEYLLNADGIFVPLYQSDPEPIQRFLQIQ